MAMIVRAKVVRIGNSRGIRIPRAMLEQAGLEDEVELTVQSGQLIISPARTARQGWAAQFAEMAGRGDDRLLDEPVSNRWDDEEWQW